MLRGLEARLDVQRGEQRLEHALGAEEAALDDPADAPGLARQRLAGREVDVGDLEERHALVSGVHVRARRADEPVEERRPQHPLVGRERLG